MAEDKNIRCEEVVGTLLAFLDGEVEARQRGLIEHHLEECRSCCSRADFELALRHKVREAAETQPSLTLRLKIRQIMDQF